MNQKISTGVSLFVLLVSAVCAQATLRTEEIEYKQGDTVLKGHLAYDDAQQGRRPGVLVVHEWWGLNDYAKRRANSVAGLGYVALAVDMYGDGKVTTRPQEAGEWSSAVGKNPEVAKARFLAALDVLRRHDAVDPARVAAIGYCFGGTTVLVMARSGVDLAGVVSFHGGLGAVTTEVPGPVRAKVLAFTGAEDPFVPEKDLAAFENGMRKAGADWQVTVYGGTKHSFTNPDADKVGVEGLAYNANANRRSWTAMTAFLDEVFAR